MVRFFRKKSLADDASSKQPDETAQTSAPPARLQPDFELREATPEELTASFLSDQDFADLAKVMPHTVNAPAPHIVGTLPPAPSQQTAPQAQAVASVVAKPAPTLPPPPIPSEQRPDVDQMQPPVEVSGFWEGLIIGERVLGWAGDASAPTRRDIHVALYVDGQPVGQARADIERKDTPHAGFAITCNRADLAQLILEERAEVRAWIANQVPRPLIMLPTVLSVARDQRARELEKANRSVGAPPPIARAADQLSLFRLPIGLQSPNGEAIVGRDGFLFAHAGAARVSELYREDGQVDAERWLTAFVERERALRTRQITYIQTILPEKTTILHEMAPAVERDVSPRLAYMETRILQLRERDPDALRGYRSLLAVLRACQNAGVTPYLRLDDRLRSLGVQLSFYQIVQQLSALMPGREEEFKELARLCGSATSETTEAPPTIGNLARHFLLPLYETEQQPVLPDFRALLPGSPTREQDQGTEILSWNNAKAPVGLSIMAIGDFGDGDTTGSFAWWLKGAFGRVGVINRPSVTVELIDRWRPNAVLYLQTERSLRQAPPQ